MKRQAYTFRLVILLAFVALLFAGCDRIKDVRPIPPDTDPGIALESPSSSNFLRTIGSTVDATFRLVDNEALKVFRITETVFNADGDTLALDSYLTDSLISGEVVLQNFNYSVMPTVAGVTLDEYYTIKLTFYAIDTKGASNSTFITVNIIPDPIGPPRFLLNSYSGRKIEHPNSFSGRHRYNFTSVTHPKPVSPPNLPLDSLGYDMEVVNSFPGPFDGKSLVSPSNEFYNRDSVFVITNAARFNYEEANYRTIREAFYSDPMPTSKILMPKVGDYVIARIIKDFSVVDHFAVIKVVSIDGGNNGSMEFDFKVSY